MNFSKIAFFPSLLVSTYTWLNLKVFLTLQLNPKAPLRVLIRWSPCAHCKGDTDMADKQSVRPWKEGCVAAQQSRLQSHRLICLGAYERTISRSLHNTLATLKTVIADEFAAMPEAEMARAYFCLRSR